MKKIDSIVLRVFLYGLPVTIMLAVFASFFNPDLMASQPRSVQTLYNFSGLVFGLWMLFSLYISTRLTFSGPFRDTVLSRITWMKERDEREAHFTGQATRTVFLSSLAILILALCLSVFTVSVHKLPPEQAIHGKTGTLSLGLGFGLWDHSTDQNTHETNIRPSLRNFDYTGLPISKSGLILFLILWHIGAYNFSMRRLMRPKQMQG